MIDQRSERCHIDGFEDGGRWLQAQECMKRLDIRKARELTICIVLQFIFIIVVGRIMTSTKMSTDFYALICEYVTSHGKRDFVNVIKDMGVEMESLSWIIQVGPI